MRYIFIGFVAMIMSGCSPNDVEIAQARFACKDKGVYLRHHMMFA